RELMDRSRPARGADAPADEVVEVLYRCVLAHEDVLVAAVVLRREVDFVPAVAAHGEKAGDDVDITVRQCRDALQRGDRTEHDVARVVVTEYRLRHELHEIDVETPDLTGGGVAVAEPERVLIDAGNEVSAPQDLVHVRAGGHQSGRGQRPERA